MLEETAMPIVTYILHFVKKICIVKRFWVNVLTKCTSHLTIMLKNLSLAESEIRILSSFCYNGTVIDLSCAFS